jgi:hypothetical protein
MITIRDINGEEFYLLKTIAKDHLYHAKRRDIRNALKNGNLFMLYGRDRSRTRHSLSPIEPHKAPGQIELGCHAFRGRNLRALIK